MALGAHGRVDAAGVEDHAEPELPEAAEPVAGPGAEDLLVGVSSAEAQQHAFVAPVVEPLGAGEHSLRIHYSGSRLRPRRRFLRLGLTDRAPRPGRRDHLQGPSHPDPELERQAVGWRLGQSAHRKVS